MTQARLHATSLSQEEAQEIDQILTPALLIHEDRKLYGPDRDEAIGDVVLTYKLTPRLIKLLKSLGLEGQSFLELRSGNRYTTYQIGPKNVIVTLRTEWLY